jgi:hypothetical protein
MGGAHSEVTRDGLSMFIKKVNYRHEVGEVKASSDLCGWSVRGKQRGIISCKKIHDSNYNHTCDQCTRYLNLNHTRVGLYNVKTS